MKVRRFMLPVTILTACILSILSAPNVPVYASAKRFMIGPYNWDEADALRSPERYPGMSP